MSFKAFISYSHAADNKLAPAIESGLRSFAKPFYKLRAMNVFRDGTSLQMTHELWPLISRSLSDSEYFILMASPDAAQSKWVQKEIGEWLKIRNGSLDKFLIVLSNGELQWDQTAADFDWTKTTALPDMLRGRFTYEPLYLDLKWARGATDLSFRNPRFLDAVATVSATVQGKPKADMIGSDVRNHRIYKMIVAGAISFLALSVGALSMSAYAFKQRSVANIERVEAITQKGLADQQRTEADRQKKLADEARENSTQFQKRVTHDMQVLTEKLRKCEGK